MKVVIFTEERDIGGLLRERIPGSVWVRDATGSPPAADAAIFFSGAMSRAWADRYSLVIDHSTHARMNPEVPNVVPHVNGEAMRGHKGVIASPNCATVILATALKPIHDAFTIRRAVVVTLQAMSGAGDTAADIWNENPVLDLEARIPQGRDADGPTAEEEETREELRRILGIDATATCIRVPVRNAHGIAVHMELEKPPENAEEVLRKGPLIRLGFPSPLRVSGSDEVHVGRIRRDPSFENGLAMWVVGDNLRRGTALNALDIFNAL